MVKITSILNERFRKKKKLKMAELAEKTTEGNLTVFSGIFGIKKLAEKDCELLSTLLQKFSHDKNADLSKDLKRLIAITSEVKAINNQAAILHGERIKQVQTMLKDYRDGAFTAWLITAYGNRQTPYNFLQYYEFHSKIPKTLHPQIDAMPRQAVYTLASRLGCLTKKEEIVRNYNGESKEEVIALIRSIFPLDQKDRRKENVGESTLKTLRNLVTLFKNSPIKMTQTQKHSMCELIELLSSLVETCEIK
ncbi:MAG: CT583 family protein [Chlamydiales bacterium]